MIHNDSSSNTSQPTTTDAGLTQTSPSISASSLSQIEGSVYSRTKASPDNLQKIPYHEHDSNALEGLTSLSHSAGSNGSRSPASSQRTSSPEKLSSYNAGQKRTATGEIKSPGLGNSKSPFRGHSRHSSTLSNGSTVTELSQQLRTRLSYAMMKVQNGWQSNTIKEVETLASQHGSPRSAVANGTSRSSWHSPRAEMTARMERQWSESGSSEGKTGVVRNEITPSQHSHGAAQRSLAPSADINPSHSKIGHPPKQSHLAKGANTSINLAIPSTPPPRGRPTSKPRTPSQTAAMEADALETLLFMSSPGNSAYQSPNRTSQRSSHASTLTTNVTRTGDSHVTSPLRSHFNIVPSEGNNPTTSPLAVITSSNHTTWPSQTHSYPSCDSRTQRSHNQRRQSQGSNPTYIANQSRNLDQILDEMSSSDGSGGAADEEDDVSAFLREKGLAGLAAGA